VDDSQAMAAGLTFEYPKSVLEMDKVQMVRRSLNERSVDILRVCINPIKPTAAFTQANLSHRPFQKMVQNLVSRKLLEKYEEGEWTWLKTTQRGRQTISLYTRLDYILNSPEMKR
jgi:predicted transcriptional regulator